MSSEKNKGRIVSKNSLNTCRRDNVTFLLMCLPVIIYLLIFSYIPMGGLILAFKNYRYDLGILGSDWVGLDNFKFFFQSQDALRVTVNTVYLNFLFIIFGKTTALIVALMLYEVTKRAAIKFFQTVYIFPHFISWVVAGFITYALFNPQLGLINSIFKSIGIQPVQWYSEARLWPAILTVVSVWKSFGMDCVIFYAALMGINRELFEAASIDGANHLKQTVHISIPSILPILIILIILAIGGIFRADFGLFFNITRDVGALYSTTDVIDTYVFRGLRVVGDVGMSSAVGFYQSIVGFVLILVTNAIVRRVQSDSALF